MFELSQEQTLMQSDDSSIKLTNFRIIEKASGKEIMLEHFEGYQYRTTHIGNYSIILILLSILTSAAAISRIKSYYDLKEMLIHPPMSFSQFIWDSWLVRLLLPLLVLSLFFFFISRRHIVRLTGRYGFIEFRVINPNSKSVESFLETIVKESNYRKTGLK